MSPQEDTLPHHLNTILLFCVLVWLPRFPLVVSHHFYSEFKLCLRSQSEYYSCHLIMRRHYSDWISAVRLSDLFHLGWWLPLALAAAWDFAASMSPVSPYSSVALAAKLLTWLSGLVERKILLCPKCPSFPRVVHFMLSAEHNSVCAQFDPVTSGVKFVARLDWEVHVKDLLVSWAEC